MTHPVLRRVFFGLTLTATFWVSAGEMRPPFIVPFDAAKAGQRFETDLRITQHRVYHLTLRLNFKEGDRLERARVRALAGDFGRDKDNRLIRPGVSVPLRMHIVALPSNAEVYSKDIHQEELKSYGCCSFSKEIDHVPLRAGRYRLTLETLSATPELASTSVSLGMGYDHKTLPLRD